MLTIQLGVLAAGQQGILAAGGERIAARVSTVRSVLEMLAEKHGRTPPQAIPFLKFLYAAGTVATGPENSAGIYLKTFSPSLLRQNSRSPVSI